MQHVLAASYERISDDDQGRGQGVDDQGLDNQRSMQPGEILVGRYTDNGVTAADPKITRHAFERLLVDIRRRKVNRIRVVHLDRLYRRYDDLDRIFALASEYGLEVLCKNSMDLDPFTAAGKLFARNLCNMGQYEVEHSKERIHDRQDARARRGEPANYQRVFGWRDGVVEIAEECAAIRRATEAALEGRSISSIAVELNRAGIFPVICRCGHADRLHVQRICRGMSRDPSTNLKSRCACSVFTARGWTATTVKQMLLRPRNAGLRQHRGQVIDCYDPNGNPAGPVWQGVISAEQFRLLQKLFAERTKPAGHNVRKWMLSSLLTCGGASGNCEDKLRIGQGPNRLAYYVCKPPPGRPRPKRGPRHVAILAEQADEIVAAAVLDVIRQNHARPDGLIGDWDDAAAARELMRRIKRVSRKIERNEQRYLDDDDYDPDEYEHQKSVFTARLGELQDELLVIGSCSPFRLFVGVAPEQIGTRWAELGRYGPNIQREIVEALYEKITVLPWQGHQKAPEDRVVMHRKASTVGARQW